MPGKVTAMKCAAMMAVMIPLVTCAAVPAGPADAQEPISGTAAPMACGKRADIVRQLGEKYGETRRSIGLSGGRSVVEVYASEATGSWTILVTGPEGTACLIAAGEAFQPEPAGGQGKPA